jgi:hypothetical protein
MADGFMRVKVLNGLLLRRKDLPSMSEEFYFSIRARDQKQKKGRVACAYREKFPTEAGRRLTARVSEGGPRNGGDE